MQFKHSTSSFIVCMNNFKIISSFNCTSTANVCLTICTFCRRQSWAAVLLSIPRIIQQRQMKPQRPLSTSIHHRHHCNLGPSPSPLLTWLPDWQSPLNRTLFIHLEQNRSLSRTSETTIIYLRSYPKYSNAHSSRRAINWGASCTLKRLKRFY